MKPAPWRPVNGYWKEKSHDRNNGRLPSTGPRISDLDYNRALSESAIRGASGAQVIVLPELMQSGYAFDNRGEAHAASETDDGPTLSLWRALASELDIIIVAGFCERLSAGRVANSLALIQPAGRLTVYRKAHLWNREKLIFTPGTEPPPVVETKIGRVAAMICYDLELPEWVRLAALAGADLLCAPVNWPDGPRPADERPGRLFASRPMLGSIACSLPPVTAMARSAV